MVATIFVHISHICLQSRARVMLGLGSGRDRVGLGSGSGRDRVGIWSGSSGVRVGIGAGSAYPCDFMTYPYD